MREEVTLGGIRFWLERVSETYTIAHPIDDPLWMMKSLHDVCIREDKKRLDMALKDTDLSLDDLLTVVLAAERIRKYGKYIEDEVMNLRQRLSVECTDEEMLEYLKGATFGS